jgi:hypothetical protein
MSNTTLTVIFLVLIGVNVASALLIKGPIVILNWLAAAFIAGLGVAAWILDR